MTIARHFLFAAAMLCATMGQITPVLADDVEIELEKLYDGDYNYGANVYLVNRVNHPMCATPKINSLENVTGKVSTSDYTLNPYARVMIGTYTEDERGYPWSFDVGADYNDGICR